MSVVQLLSRVQLFATPWTRAPQTSLSFTIRVRSNSCPLSLWCCLTIPSSATLFSFCLQSCPESGSSPVSCCFISGGQSIEASASVLPVNIQGWFPLGLTGLIFLQSKRLSGVFSSTTIWKHQFFGTQPSLHPKLTSIHDYWKTITLSRQTFVRKVMPLLFNIYKISHLLYPSIC